VAGAGGRRDDEERAHREVLAAEIARFLDRRAAEPVQHGEPLPAPPGQPIGSATAGWGVGLAGGAAEALTFGGAPPGLPPLLAGCSWEEP
jgi:hypothetical protein